MQDEPDTVDDQDPNPVRDGDGPSVSSDELERLTEHVTQLEAALLTRDIIGQAKGILMERHRITEEEAFDRLRKASQHMNRKLRDLAEELVRTGDSERSG